MNIKELFKMVETANEVSSKANCKTKFYIKVTFCDEVRNTEVSGEFKDYFDSIEWIRKETNYDIMNWFKNVTFEYNRFTEIVSLDGEVYGALSKIKFNVDL